MLFQIAVFYNGDEIPDSPFAMTSNPNLEDVISATNAKGLNSSRKSSRDSEISDLNNPDLMYSRNGTGRQRKASKGKLNSGYKLKDNQNDTLTCIS